jgi:hypothetical protein
MLEGISFAMILSKLRKVNKMNIQRHETEYSGINKGVIFTWLALRYQQWQLLL